MSYLRTDTVPKEFWSSYTLSIVVYVLSNWHLHGYEDSETPLQISKSSWRSNPSWEDPNFLDFIISAEINVSWWFIVSIILAHMAPGYSRSRIISQWRGLRQIFFFMKYITLPLPLFLFLTLYLEKIVKTRHLAQNSKVVCYIIVPTFF